MQANRDLIGAGPNLAASAAGGMVFLRFQTSLSFLDLNGDLILPYLLNAGSKNMAVSGSLATPITFEYVVPANKQFMMLGTNIIIVDDAMTPLKFGGIGAGPLANGIIWRIVDASNVTVLNFHAGASIVANYEFQHLAIADWTITQAQDSLVVNWRSVNFGSIPILQTGWKIQIIIRDNLTLLDKFEASLVGRLVDPVTFAA